jgi:hypothetical protein
MEHPTGDGRRIDGLRNHEKSDGRPGASDGFIGRRAKAAFEQRFKQLDPVRRTGSRMNLCVNRRPALRLVLSTCQTCRISDLPDDRMAGASHGSEQAGTAAAPERCSRGDETVAPPTSIISNAMAEHWGTPGLDREFP